MVAKMALPQLGGTPAVWNTCMVFFQAALLIGYALADRFTTHLRPRGQALLQVLLLLGALLVLPIDLGASTRLGSWLKALPINSGWLDDLPPASLDNPV